MTPRPLAPPRRVALHALFATAVTGAVAAALAPVIVVSRRAGWDAAGPAMGPGADTAEDDSDHEPDFGVDPAFDAGFDSDFEFDEMYRGRRIRGSARGGGQPTVTVDGRPLHLMRRADGGYMSMVDHYESYPSALAATRAAVDELGPATLAPRHPA